MMNEAEPPSSITFITITCPPLLDSFTVPLHSPNGRHLPAIRAVQWDCQWDLKNGRNSHWSCEQIMQQGTRLSQSIFWSTNQSQKGDASRVMPANWRPCLLPHNCHRDKTVKQSSSLLMNWTPLSVNYSVNSLTAYRNKSAPGFLAVETADK